MTPTLRIRPARPTDLPAVLALEEQGFAAAHRWSAQAWSDELAAGDRLLRVAESTDPAADLLGVITVRVADVAELNRVVVAADHRRTGVASRLITGLLPELAPRAEQFWLEVADDNVAARELYARLGFAEIGRRRGYYPAGVDAVIMSRSIPGAGEQGSREPGSRRAGEQESHG